MGAKAVAASFVLANATGQNGKNKQRNTMYGTAIGYAFGGPVGAQVGAFLGGLFDQPTNDKKARRSAGHIVKSGFDFGGQIAKGMRDGLIEQTSLNLGLKGLQSIDNPAFMRAAQMGFDFTNILGGISDRASSAASTKIMDSSTVRTTGLQAAIEKLVVAMNGNGGNGDVHINQQFGDIHKTVDLDRANSSMAKTWEQMARRGSSL